MTQPNIILTAGEPAGIGPDLAVMLSQHALACNLVVLANPELIKQRAAQLGIALKVHSDEGDAHEVGHLCVRPLQAGAVAASVRCGELNKDHAQYLHDSITTAAKACLQSEFDAMVTGPVHKGIINDAGIEFSGHTELIEQVTGAKQSVMMLANTQLRVALLTTHLPLSAVPAAVTPSRIESVLAVIKHDLQHKFGIAEPNILVCGLNPHAGEGGHLGMEEIEVIEPTLDDLRKQGYQLDGPLPADTAFTPDKLAKADAVLAMYHDQGLPVIKSMGFGEIVNITLGLPIIRTSVDHGTALDIAGTGKAKVSSLLYAIEQAITMVQAQKSI